MNGVCGVVSELEDLPEIVKEDRDDQKEFRREKLEKEDRIYMENYLIWETIIHRK